MLKFIEPMIPTMSETAPDGDDWVHEIKYDGYRAQLILEDDKVRIFTRNGYDWTNKFGPIALAARKLPCSSAIIDGEIIVPDERGIANFNALPEAVARSPGRLIFVAFDLLYQSSVDFRPLPLIECYRSGPTKNWLKTKCYEEAEYCSGSVRRSRRGRQWRLHA